MNGVRDQRQRVGGIAEHQLGDHEHRVERDAYRKRKAEMIGRVAVPDMAMRVAVIVPMIVRMIVMMVVVMGHGACDSDTVMPRRMHSTADL